jgi:glycosyltransferase involved in cell wall biosynthesis
MTDEHGASSSEKASRLRSDGVLIVEQGGRGGVADYTNCLASALAKRGLPVTLATANDHLYVAAPGIRIVPVFAYTRGHSALARLTRRIGLGPAINGVRFLLALPSLAAVARHSAVVHVQGWERPSLGILATLLMRAAGARIVYTAHNVFERHAHTLDSGRVFPALAVRTIVHTNADQARVRRPVVVIPHGSYGPLADRAPTIEPQLARAELGIPSERLVVLLFGHLRPDKGLGDLLEALARAPSWHGLIAGEEDGALAQEADRITSAVREGRVTLREGFHDIDAVARFFSAADLVALPYRQASQSGVLLLAYGFARPVAAYPVGGMVEAVLNGETGWICERATPDALADVLNDARLAGREELHRRGELGRRWSAEMFSWDRIAAATEAVYESALITDTFGSVKGRLKDLVGDRWRRRFHALSRLRWIAKYRILRNAGVSPLNHLGYVLFDPEVESYTYRVANVDEMLTAIAEVTGVPRNALAGYAAETDSDPELGDRLARRLRWRFDVKHRPPLGNRLGWYVLVRAVRPSLVLETGIYHGLGSLTLLRALERNRAEGSPGRLVSFDSSPDTGWMVDRGSYPEWRMVVGLVHDTLEPALAGQQVGALFHDSVHTEEHQQFEFGVALKHAAPSLLVVEGSGGECPTLERLSQERGATYRCVPLVALDHWYQRHGLAFALFRSTDND